MVSEKVWCEYGEYVVCDYVSGIVLGEFVIYNG